MRYLLIISLIIVSFSVSSCLKDKESPCEAVAPETEAAKMKAFCEAQKINYSTLSSGLFYEIIEPGEGVSPTTDSRVKVNYTGTLLTGEVFDKSTDSPTFTLSGLITGWRQGLPLIKKGGRIKLVVPSYLGYGCAAMPGLPANSVLYFDISLLDVL